MSLGSAETRVDWGLENGTELAVTVTWGAIGNKKNLVFKSVVRFFDHSKQACLVIAFFTFLLLVPQVSHVFHRKPTCSLALWDRILVLDFVRIAIFSNLYNFTYKKVASFRCFLSFLFKSYQNFFFHRVLWTPFFSSEILNCPFCDRFIVLIYFFPLFGTLFHESFHIVVCWFGSYSKSQDNIYAQEHHTL